jgi:hypothetical protein
MKTEPISAVSEGLENALSIKEVQPNANIISSFGVRQLQNLSIETGTKVIVLCLDNDEPISNTKNSLF